MVLQRYGEPIRNRSDAEAFLAWLRAERLSDCTIAGLIALDPLNSDLSRRYE